METISSGESPGGSLDLERADFGDAAATEIQCRSCGVAISDFYFTVGEIIHCERCRLEQEAKQSQGSALVRLSRAGVFGLLAAAIGAGLWAAVTHFTGYEIGLVAIAVGWAVGTAVRVGSGARGGIGYQLLAVLLTYLAIVSTYTPYVIEGLQQAAEGEVSQEAGEPIELTGSAATPELEGEGAYAESFDAIELSAGEQAVAVVLFAVIVLGIAAAAPFLAGAENLIGILIIGIALWEAWRLNRRVELAFAGPFEVGKEPRTAA